MGRDLDVVRTLAPLGFGQEILISGEAKRVADREGVGAAFKEISPDALRECRSREAWRSRFLDRGIYIQRLISNRSPGRSNMSNSRGGRFRNAR